MYPRTTHVEQHFTGSATVRDVVIGMSDGLTVPFALAAGLSGAVQSSFLVLVAGIAEMAAGSIAMGLGGYLAARSEADSYRAELAREWRQVRELPDAETAEIRQIFSAYGLGLPLSAAFLSSVVVTLLALLAFGAVKGHFTSVPPLRGALQTAVVGGVAAGFAYGLARLVSGGH
jgi:VIT1/CCC1 family predicted Fe2+/Mn2+ transporter